MAGASILHRPGSVPLEAQADEAYLTDLHLDALLRRISDRRADADLYDLYLRPLADEDAIRFRQEVFRDIERPELAAAISEFCDAMAGWRELAGLAGKARYPLSSDRWHLDSAEAYVRAVRRAAAALEEAGPASRGLQAIGRHLAELVGSADFTRLSADVDAARSALDAIEYRLDIDGSRVLVSPPGDDPDYGAEIVETFARFAQDNPREFRFGLSESSDMNHVEAAILDRVAMIHPQAFAGLRQFRLDHAAFVDPVLRRFDRDVQFYRAYLAHIAPLRARGLPFSYPEVSSRAERESAAQTFDLVLADRLDAEGRTVVTNDLEVRSPERLIVVTGPNQGGKTTFGRTFGQLHHLARIGVPVPGRNVTLLLADRIYTHFERQEGVEDLAGKLEQDLRRIKGTLEAATPTSVVIMNETFSSTTLEDQLLINRRVVGALLASGCRAVIVTFLDELASGDPAIVSMVSTLDPEQPERRTFKVVRRQADGLAYAMSIAEKHGLTAARIAERLEANEGEA